jgi:hypothetical protein
VEHDQPDDNAEFDGAISGRIGPKIDRNLPEFSTLGCFAPRPLSPLDNPAEPLPFPKVAAFGLTAEITGFHSFADFSTV